MYAILTQLIYQSEGEADYFPIRLALYFRKCHNEVPKTENAKSILESRAFSRIVFEESRVCGGGKGSTSATVYIYIVYSPRYVASILGPKARGGGSEDISRCRPTYHSFAARPTPRSIHKLRSAKVNGGVGRYGAIALHKTSLARQVGEVDGGPHPVVCVPGLGIYPHKR